jgi:hypothetical protein
MQKIPEIIEFKLKLSDAQRKICSSEFSVCGSHIVIVDDTRALYVVAVDSGRSRKLIADAKTFVFCQSTNELAVASNAGGGMIHRFDVEQDGLMLAPLSCPFVSCLTYACSGKSIIAGDSRGFLHEFRLDWEPFPAKTSSRKFVSETGLRALCANRSRIYAATDSGGLFSVRPAEIELPDHKQWLLHASDWDSYAVACHDSMQMGAIAGYGSYIRFYRMQFPTAQILPTSFAFIYKMDYLPRAGLLAVVGDHGLEFWKIDCVQPFLVECFTNVPNIKAIKEVGGQLLVACF